MAFSANELTIENFRDTFYPKLILSRSELETLSWCITNPVVTPSGQTTMDVHFEVKRALNRLNNIDLLRADDYARFVSLQTEPKMTLDQFNFFSEKIKSLTDSEVLALRAVTLIGSIPFAPEAKARAIARLGSIPVDSIEFLDATLSNCPDIYPVYKDLTTDAALLLGDSFAFGHLRHMLYIEGNQGMFKALQNSCEQIKDTVQRSEHFDFWYMQWFINITGFKVSTDPAKDPCGSLYLNHDNTAALIQLNQLLKQAIKDPSLVSTILPSYLDFRSSKLGLDEREQHKLITQIAAWSRIYTPNPILSKLNIVISTIDKALLAQPDQLNTRTPTYVPAVFDNLIALLPNETELAFRMALTLYSTAYNEYLKHTVKGDPFNTPPLSFRLAADKANLQLIIDDLRRFPKRKNEIPCCQITLNDKFEVILQPKPEPSPLPFAYAAAKTVTEMIEKMTLEK